MSLIYLQVHKPIWSCSCNIFSGRDCRSIARFHIRNPGCPRRADRYHGTKLVCGRGSSGRKRGHPSCIPWNPWNLTVRAGLAASIIAAISCLLPLPLCLPSALSRFLCALLLPANGYLLCLVCMYPLLLFCDADVALLRSFIVTHNFLCQLVALALSRVLWRLLKYVSCWTLNINYCVFEVVTISTKLLSTTLNIIN